MKRKPPSIHDVAKQANVSAATVSNVLAGRTTVDRELVKRVKAAVLSLGYVADASAQRMRSSQSTVAGVLVPDLANPFFGLFVAALEKAAQRSGIDLLVASSGEDPTLEQARLKALVAWRPIGIVAIPCDVDFAARQHAIAAHIPLIFTDRIPHQPPADTVAVNNMKSAFDGASTLFRKGHRSILAVASDLRTPNIRERYEGIKAAAQASEHEIKVEVIEVGSRADEIRPLISAWINGNDDVTAMFSLTNLATFGCFSALKERGVQMPDRMALLGFDDYDWMTLTAPSISAIRQPITEMAEHSWAVLETRLRDPSGVPRNVRLPCEIVWRGSTG